MFTSRISKYIATYFTELDGNVDALVFTGGIGENSPIGREDITRRLRSLGIAVDSGVNENTMMRRQRVVTDISHTIHGKIRTLVVPADEELQIAKQTKLLTES